MKKKEVDLIDLRIIKILSTNANISNKDLAKQIDLSPAPTLVRYRNLFNRGIFLKYKVVLNYEYFGYTSRYQVQITLFKEHVPQLEHICSKFRSVFNLQKLEPVEFFGKNIVHMYFEYMLKENESVDSLQQALQGIPDLMKLEIYRFEKIHISDDLFFLSEEDVV